MYSNESKVLEDAKKVVESHEADGKQSVPLDQYRKLVNEYDSLLGEIKFITRISDRLQNKLNGINQNLLNKTNELEKAQTVIMQQNEELQIAKDSLELKVSERTQALQKANENLQASIAELDNFVYRASHDIKGPIASIMGVCNVATIEAPNEHTKQYFEMLLDVSTQLQNKLNRLLGISKLKNADISLKPESANELISASIREVETLSKDRPVNFVAKIPEEGEFMTDAEIFHIMIGNLLEYAAKNARSREEAIQNIRIKALLNTNLQLFVSYKGDMIPATLTDKVFKMFYRTSNDTELTGMELYTSNLLAEKLNGRVELISSTDQETIFSVFLPDVEVS